MRYVEVAVDAPAGFDRTFSYSVPSHLSLSPGHLVLAPFGPRKLLGVVFSVESMHQVSETRDILGALAPRPLLSSHQLDLARWLSRYYVAPLFESAALMLPPGFRSRLRDYIFLNASAAASSFPPGLTDIEREVLKAIGSKASIEKDALLRAVGLGAEKALRRLLNADLLFQETRWDSSGVGFRQETYVRLTETARIDHQKIINSLTSRAPKQAALVKHLASQSESISLAGLRKLFGAAAVKGVMAKDLLTKEMIRVERDPLAGKTFHHQPPPLLTSHQQDALAHIYPALVAREPNKGVFMLHGITGSGKTEVYMRAVERCIQLGKKAIVLVPEIALTPQTIQRFASRFPGQVALLHSRLSSGQHLDQWRGIKDGHYSVVVGPRSAIFSPQPNLGLIVVDEEHEWTYKQHEQAPRYHIRGVAFKLADLTGAVVLFGSATPDVSTYYHALRGRLRLLELPHRVVPERVIEDDSHSVSKKKELPNVQVIDMRQELREGNRSIFSRALKSQMESALRLNQQVILFLNRRGSASYVQCGRCGFTLLCRRCDVALTFHSKDQTLLCHYCNEKRPLLDKCPDCRSRRIRPLGQGTQSVVEQVKADFSGVDVLRWDRDATRNPKAHEELLTSFQRGEAQVLVGTQMIAKGLHVPSVTLVGVISADTGLNLPDFRSGERVYQLLSQISGRTGRGLSQGDVIIQTYQPHHYAIVAAAKQDYKDFYNREIEFRKQHGNPPFNRLIRLLYAHTNQGLCQKEAQKFSIRLLRERESWGINDIELVGPAPALPARVRGHYRWHLILRGAKPELLLEKVTIPQGWTIDVDPVTTV